jgi:shikimate 5-dehydrogenase
MNNRTGDSMNTALNTETAIFHNGALVGDNWDDAATIEMRKAAVDTIIAAGGMVPAICAAILDEGEVKGALYYYTDIDAKRAVARLGELYRFEPGTAFYPIQQRTTAYDHIMDINPYELVRICNTL